MKLLETLQRWLRPPEPAAAPDEDLYARRLANEKQAFDECPVVHDLPPIYEYWAAKFLVPMFAPFGITDTEQFFFLYTQKFHEHFPHSSMRIASVGCGNCDLEVRLARRLVDAGIDDFTIECIDINEVMLARGVKLAESHGVAEHILTTTFDINRWEPRQTYDIIIACHSLHHVVELEQLFAVIRHSLNPEGYFLTVDMIGRNGHMRWPEALALVQEFWRELPERYRYNHSMKRHEPEFINHDCSTEGFEGIRAQDILPLLIQNFHFEFFAPFSNIVTVFIDRPFGPNFDVTAEWDTNFIDRVHARDEEGILSGELKPTQMGAVLRNRPVETTLLHPRLTPQFCVRVP